MVDERLELAKELGATHVLNPGKVDVSEEIKKITGYGLNYAFDTTGSPKVIRQAVEALALKGTCAVVGASGPDAEIVVNETHFMSGGRRLMGVVEGEANSDVYIPTLIRLWQQGRFPFDKLITFFPFDKINDAIAASANGNGGEGDFADVNPLPAQQRPAGAWRRRGIQASAASASATACSSVVS